MTTHIDLLGLYGNVLSLNRPFLSSVPPPTLLCHLFPTVSCHKGPQPC